MSNTNTVPTILPSMDYHREVYNFYLGSVDSLKENVQYPNGYFYPSTSTQNSPQIPGVQLGNSFAHFEYPRPHLNQINWEQSQNIQDYHRFNSFHSYNVQKRDSQVSSVDALHEPARLPPRPAPPRGDQVGVPRDPWAAHAELLNASVAAELPLQPFSVKQPISSESSDYKNDQSEIKEPHGDSLELLDLDSILAAYHGNEAEETKSFNDLTQIGNPRHIKDQNVTNNVEMTHWAYNSPAALQMPSTRPVYPAPSALPHVSSKTAPRKSNVAKGLKTFNCTACEKWFTSSGHLKRHYRTSIHNNSVRTSGQPDPAAASAPPRRAAAAATRTPPPPSLTQTAPAPHTLPPFSHLRGNPYTSGSLDTTGTAVSEAKYGPIYLRQNQQHLTLDHPNTPGPEDIDILGNNPTIAKPDPSGDTSPESGDIVARGLTHHSTDGRLPSFAQLHKQRFGTEPSNFFNRMEQQRDDSSSFKTVEELVSICVPLNGYIMEEETKQQLQIFNNEPATGPERDKAGDPSVSPPPAAPAPHECLACGKRFTRACSLTQHNNSSHSGARLFKCARCGKRFADEATRTRHGARHVGRKPFGCEACPKSFNHKSDLRRHMCLHAAGKPFTCALCGKGFVRRDHMLKHVNTHAKRVTRGPSSSSLSSTPP